MQNTTTIYLDFAAFSLKTSTVREFMVYSVLRKLCAKNEGFCLLPFENEASLILGMSRRCFKKHLLKLQELGWAQIRKGKLQLLSANRIRAKCVFDNPGFDFRHLHSTIKVDFTSLFSQNKYSNFKVFKALLIEGLKAVKLRSNLWKKKVKSKFDEDGRRLNKWQQIEKLTQINRAKPTMYGLEYCYAFRLFKEDYKIGLAVLSRNKKVAQNLGFAEYRNNHYTNYSFESWDEVKAYCKVNPEFNLAQFKKIGSRFVRLAPDSIKSNIAVFKGFSYAYSKWSKILTYGLQ